jgi:hypothetical protein
MKSMTKTNRLLIKLVNKYSADRIAARLHRYKGMLYTSTLDIRAWVIGEATPSPEQIEILDKALPRIEKHLSKTRTSAPN